VVEITPDCHLLSRLIKWLSLSGIHQFAPLFGVPHFAQIAGSVWRRLMAHYGADYSLILKRFSIDKQTDNKNLALAPV